jgi:hypothetical protein
MAPPALDGAASCLAISDRRAATYRIKASAVGVLSGSAEADSSLVGHGGDPLGPQHRRELAEHAVGLLQPRVAATPPSPASSACRRLTWTDRLVGHQRPRYPGGAV